MTKALAFTRAHVVRLADPLEIARSAIVLSCAAALIAAGPLVPVLG